MSVMRLQRAARGVPRCTAANGASAASRKPSPAETARTIIDICREGTLSTLGSDGSPIGTPVSFSLDKEGHPCVELHPGSLELLNLARDARCSLQVQPTQFPARAVASVTLLGRLDAQGGPQQGEPARMQVERCLYFGGLDQVCHLAAVWQQMGYARAFDLDPQSCTAYFSVLWQLVGNRRAVVLSEEHHY